MEQAEILSPNSSQAYRQAVVNWGLYLGATLAAVDVVRIGVIRDPMGGGWLSIIELFALIFMGYRAMLSYQRQAGGVTLTYGKCFGIGTLVILIGSAVHALVYWIMLKYINPQYFREMIRIMEENFTQSLALMPEDQVEVAHQMLRSMFTPAFMAFSGLLGMIFNGLIATLLSSLWGKRNYTLRAPQS